MSRSIRVAVSVAAAVVVICGAAVAWLTLAPRRVPQGQPPLTMMDTRSLPAFRDAFNASKGEVRILAMLSPT